MSSISHMPLFKVTIAGLVQRYVDAEDASAAVREAEGALLRQCDIRATAAPPEVASLWSRMSSSGRQRLLARLDGLAPPPLRRVAQRRARLERLIREEEALQEHANARGAAAPPMSAEVVERVAALVSVFSFVESSRQDRAW